MNSSTKFERLRLNCVFVLTENKKDAPVFIYAQYKLDGYGESKANCLCCIISVICCCGGLTYSFYPCKRDSDSTHDIEEYSIIYPDKNGLLFCHATIFIIHYKFCCAR